MGLLPRISSICDMISGVSFHQVERLEVLDDLLGFEALQDDGRDVLQKSIQS